MRQPPQRNIVVFLSRVLFVSGSAAVCHAGPWINPSGSAHSFTYSNGQDVWGLFGEPVLSGDTLSFPNLHLTASAADGQDGGPFDVVSFDLVPNPGLSFGAVRVSAVGSYAITGDGGEVGFHPNTSTQVWENDGLGRGFTDLMLTEPAFPQSNGNSGWRGLSILDLSFEDPPLDPSLHFQFAAGVFAISGQGGTAEIDLRLLGGMTFTFVPEAGTVGMLAIATAIAGIRRERRT